MEIRTARLLAASVVVGVLFATSAVVAGPALEKAEAWAPVAEAAPAVSPGDDGVVAIRSNGTRLCCGGWQYVYSGIQAGQGYCIRVQAHHEGLPNARDCLAVIVLWDKWDPNDHKTSQQPWNYAVPTFSAEDTVDFCCSVKAPPDATHLTVRYVFRWSPDGASRWTAPQIAPVTLAEKKPVTICVVATTRRAPDPESAATLPPDAKLPADVAEKVELWADLVRKACDEKPQLIVTPEVVISGKNFLEGAVTVPGPATQPFQRLAREHRTHIVLGVRERDGDAVRNSAVLIGPDGNVAGVYRKVHLAASEQLSGTLPGNSFPVFNTGIGRIGCLICMDTTVCESVRMLALGGADIVCFPIMGDLRADRWSPGRPIYNEDRWKAIMRTRAIDNQVCMAVARNNVQGSCIIDRKGDILAWNEGDREIITATLPADDGYRTWNGGDFREVTFMLRRPDIYRPYTDENNFGPVQPEKQLKK